MKVKVKADWDYKWDIFVSVKSMLPRVTGISQGVIEAVILGDLSAGRYDWHSKEFGHSSITWDLNPLSGKQPWIEGESTTGNRCRITDHEISGVVVEFSGRRHAMRNYVNEAGELFSPVFGGRWEDGIEIPLNIELLERFTVLSYESTRLDVPWWECGSVG